MKKYIAVVCFLFFFSYLYSQAKSVAFEAIQALESKERRNILVFIHTDWCKYCHLMQDQTFKNQRLIETLNQSFYFISLDAEYKKPIDFNNTIFKYKPNGNRSGTHELALALGTIDNKIEYPTICILNPDYEIIFQYSGFLSSDNLVTLLQKL
jgi:thioredoxin-related protein